MLLARIQRIEQCSRIEISEIINCPEIYMENVLEYVFERQAQLYFLGSL